VAYTLFRKEVTKSTNYFAREKVEKNMKLFMSNHTRSFLGEQKGSLLYSTALLEATTVSVDCTNILEFCAVMY
jgi:hypothetical protein